MGARPWWWALAVCACGLAGLAAGSRAGAAEPKAEVVEAEMLKDLDILREANMAQQGEFLRRMGVLERLRLLESLPFLEGLAPADPAAKEEK